jgi:uncharacterized phage infection (PIP) family protein YhgE
MVWRALSLRSKLLFLALAGLATVVVFAFFQANQSFNARASAQKSDYASRAVLAGQNISSSFFERAADIEAFASNTVFQTVQRDAITAALNILVAGYQVYDTIMFVDDSGKFVASNTKTFDGRTLDNKTMEGRSFADTTWFQNVIKADPKNDKIRSLGNSYFEDLQVDPISSALHGTTLQGVSFSRLVNGPDGRRIGVLTARVSIRFVENELHRVFESMRFSGVQTAQLMLLNKDGLLSAEVSADLIGEKGEVKRNQDRILRWNVATQLGQAAAQEAVAGKTGSLIEHDRVMRSERVWGYHQIKDSRIPDQLNWSVIVSAASDEVMADLAVQRRIFYSLLFIFTVAFGLAGYGAARSLVREYLEYSVKLKDETIRLIEVGDALNEALKRVGSQEPVGVETVSQAIQKGREMSDQMVNRAEALTESASALRDVMAATSENTQQLSAVTECLTGVEQSVQAIVKIEHSLNEIDGRLGELNDLVFKAQLVGFNASIEASRAGQNGKGFANVAQEIRGFSDTTERISRDLSEALSRSRRQLVEADGAVKQRIAEAVQVVSDVCRTKSRLDSGLPRIVEAIEGSAQSLKEQDEIVRSICAEFELFESAFSKTGNVRGELNRFVQDVREQSYRLEDVVQDLGHSVKGLRVRSRLKKNQTQMVFRHGADVSPERARADAVDRLAQKMRPRLVVEAEEHEPEVSDSSFNQETTKRAG